MNKLSLITVYKKVSVETWYTITKYELNYNLVSTEQLQIGTHYNFNLVLICQPWLKK